jgi:hypothetical protein
MKASDDEAGGAFLVFEDACRRARARPRHVHANEVETLYVLETAAGARRSQTAHRA